MLEQSLARVDVALMLKPVGFLLSNDRLLDAVPAGLYHSLLTKQVVIPDPEFMFSYERRN